MRPLPRYWALHADDVTIPENPLQPDWRLAVWGSSNESADAAQADADRRFTELVAAGGPSRVGDEWYYPMRRLPEELLEEIHGENGELIAAITRNRYGARVLNTDAVLITDIDLPEPARPATGGGLISRLFGRGRAPEQPGDPDAAVSETLQRIDAFARARPELGVSTYRTRAGFRLFITGTGAAPDDERAREIMAELDSDPLYAVLCRVHATYRARLTPKPWRAGMESFTPASPRANGPRFSAVRPPDGAWLARYERASAEHATCRLVGRTGADPNAVEQRIIDLHDRETLVGTQLPLA